MLKNEDERLRKEAENLLEKVLMRKRWTAPDRDRIAAFLKGVVRRAREARGHDNRRKA